MAHAHGHEEHGEHDGHDHAAHEHEVEDLRLRVLHGASPFCDWSYAYEGVLNRVKLVYGDQIKVNIYQIPVYDSWQEWLENYGMTQEEALDWFGETKETSGLPYDREYWKNPPKTCTLGTLFVHAAAQVSPEASERLARRINFGVVFEGRRYDNEKELYQLVDQLHLPRKDIEAALKDGRAAESLRQDNQDMHSLGLNFYTLQVRDAEGKTSVHLEHAFDPTRVESAVEWMGGGKLKKHALPTLEAYAVQHAPVSARELTQVFKTDVAKVRAGLAAAEKSGKLVHKTLLGHDCWLPPK